MPLLDAWIDWQKPDFIGQDPDWDKFLKKQRRKYPDLPGDLEAAIKSLDVVWIVKQKSGFEFDPVSKVMLRIA